jgi:uncharacterized protein (DUF1330 family)
VCRGAIATITRSRTSTTALALGLVPVIVQADEVSAYAIFEVTLHPDPGAEALAAYERYRAAVPVLIESHGGRYLARGWRGEALEGAGVVDRYHLVEFPDADAAHAFWSSPEYLAVKHGRDDAVSVRAVLIAPPG